MKGPRPDIDAQLYVRVLENVDRAIIAVDRMGNIILCNPAAQACTGFSERQSLGRSFADLFAGQQPLQALVAATLTGGRSISDHQSISLQRPGQPPLPVSVSVSPLYTEEGELDGAVLIIRDLSRVRELEEAVRRADRLSMLGTLAAGLAHEVKNPLGGIKGAAQLLSMELGAGSHLQEYTEVMIREVERVNDIIEELMDLSRPRPPVYNQVNLLKILNDIVLLQQEAHRDKRIDFRLSLDPSIPPIHGDGSLLARLFLNLVKNAAEAIEECGTIEIHTRIASDYHMSTPDGQATPLVVVEIRDNGCGMHPDELEAIFTPFYTTKSRGSGLGLATCQKIISEHQGFFLVDSTPGQGTVFTVSLPLRRKAN